MHTYRDPHIKMHACVCAHTHDTHYTVTVTWQGVTQHSQTVSFPKPALSQHICYYCLL